MPYSPRVLSLNVGKLRNLQVGSRLKQTGLFKQPVQGPQLIDATGLPGDDIVNRRFHGGPDQAVYLYSQEDIDWWKQQLQRDIDPGFFGENLTITHWWPSVRVGDILQVGELRMEITAPRVPCAVLAARVGSPAFVKQFVHAGRCGAYARVLQPGSLSPGEMLHITAADDSYPTVEEIFRYWHSKTQNADFLRRVLAAPIAFLLREALTERLLKAEAGTPQLPMF
ncbi:MOSC domain-containing protein [Pseudomonas profundi]|uniref:MOSC domain-containing protein n=1 Tax=Pseudomonas profundi TaxID=1981513 RepID=UPI00123C0EBD|nr:MOSC domain-containing protein [Pseudomonas profundi]